MSRGFNEHEKQLLTDALIEQGRILFSTFGFQKTSVHEITKKVGIAQGSFYTFFHSKEELYFLILEKEEAKIREHFLTMQATHDVVPQDLFKQILREMIDIIETNPLIRELYFDSNLEKLMKRLPPEMLEKHFSNDSDVFVTFIEKWKKDGIILKEKPEVIAGMIRSLFLLTFHRKEIGEQVYEETIELMINLIVDGLIS